MREMKNQKLLIIISIIVVLIFILFGLFRVLYPYNASKESDFVGEKVVLMKFWEDCKTICENTAKKPCYDYYGICQESGQVTGERGLKWECAEYFKQNPDVLDKYPCTFYIAQSMEGDPTPCAFSCK